MRGARGDPSTNRTRHVRPRPDRRCDVRRRRERSPGGPRRHGRQEECLDRPREPLPTRVKGLPDLPEAYHRALDGLLDELGITLEARAREAIDGHVRLLLAWSAAINLTAIRDPAEIALRHVADSLTAVPLLGSDATDLIDLGSGGGYPGLPLAAALPALRVRLVDSIGKKAAFLRAAASATGLAERVAVDERRAEALAAEPSRRERSALVSARAVAALPDLVELAFPLLVPGGRLIAWKRGEIGTELAAARRAAEALADVRVRAGSRPLIEVHEVRVAALAGHRLVVLTKAGRTPAGYPRDPAARRRNPW